MKKFTTETVVQVRVSGVPVEIPDEIYETHDSQLIDTWCKDRVISLLHDRLTILDIKGSRTGDDGCVETIEINPDQSIWRWEVDQ